MEPNAVAELLRNEHPQIVAAVLVHLEIDQAASVMKLFTERHRNEVLVRVATLDGIQPAGLKDLNEVMSALLTGNDRMRTSLLGGAKAAAEMLNSMGSSVETSALDFIRDADNELAQQIMDNMFSFEDLVKVDDKGIQALLKEIQTESLVIALKAAPPELQGEDLQEHVDARGRDAQGRARDARPGAGRRGGSRAEGDAQGRASPDRRRRDRARGRQR